MAANTTPIFPAAPVTGSALCTAANTNYAAPTAAVAVIPAASIPNGARITSVTAEPLATVTATEIQLYRYDGTNYHFLKSVQMAAYTVAQTTANVPTDFGYSDNNPLYLAAGDALFAAIGVALATGIKVHAFGGKY